MRKSMKRKSKLRPQAAPPTVPDRTVQDYVDKLNRRYALEGSPPNRKAWLAEELFNFTTYSDEISEALLDKCRFVMQKAHDRSLSEYINESPENYVQAMMIMNMANFIDWFEWGTSVRGAWLDTTNRTLDFWGPDEPTNCTLLYKAIEQDLYG